MAKNPSKKKKGKSYIGAPMAQDEAMFETFRCINYLTAKQLENLVSQNRSKNMMLEKYIEKCHFQKGTKHMMIYRLTPEGKKYAEMTYGMKNFYQSSSPTHDLKLGEFYFSLKQEQRQTWNTEGDLRERWDQYMNLLYTTNRPLYEHYNEMHDMKQISMPDCTYKTNYGEEVAHDIVTEHYSQELKDSKAATAQVFGIRMEFENVK